MIGYRFREQQPLNKTKATLRSISAISNDTASIIIQTPHISMSSSSLLKSHHKKPILLLNHHTCNSSSIHIMKDVYPPGRNKRTAVWSMIDAERWEGLDDSEHADREVLAIVVCPATREEARLFRSRSRVTVTNRTYESNWLSSQTQWKIVVTFRKRALSIWDFY